ncbi:MAG: hypothetical protein Q4P32_06045 [Micrococcales bacterium]|nr:hypothetical protein [Micrococcales bacterium]
MAKLKTPYDTLLRIRRIEEDKAKAALAVANHAQRAAAAALQDRRSYYASAAVAPDGETDLGAFQRQVAHGTAAARAVGIAAGSLQSSQRTTQQAIEATRAASMRSQGLEKLVARAKDAWMHEMLAADQRTAEESMAGKRGRARRRGVQ